MILRDFRERAVKTLNIFKVNFWINTLGLSRQKSKLLLSPDTFTPKLQQELPRIGSALKCQWGFPTGNWKRECNIFFLFYVQPIFIARLRGLDFKVLKIFKFNRKGKISPTFFVRVSYFFPPGLIVWISPTAVWHCKAFWGWQMLFKIKFCSSLQYCACPRITFL